MQRRKFLIGMGALTAGGAAAIGTGAYSAADMDREANIEVVNDTEGLIGLVPTADTDVVRLSETGELLIDFTADGYGGVNTDSRYQVGYIRAANKAFVPEGLNDQIDDTSASAFQVVNNDTIPHSLDARFECDASDIGNAEIFWQFHIKTRQHQMSVSGTNTSADMQDIPKVNQADSRWLPGDAVDVTLLVDARDVPAGMDLSGTLTLEAGEDPYA